MSMDFKRGGQAIQRIRKERGMTQEDLADKSGITSNTVSRIERGLLIPALPTLIDICNTLETGADSILAAYITADTPIRWPFLIRGATNLSRNASPSPCVCGLLRDSEYRLIATACACVAT